MIQKKTLKCFVSQEKCEYFFLNKNFQLRGTLMGELSILKHLYINDYAEFVSKISNLMFLHEYLLVCEIFRVRILALISY